MATKQTWRPVWRASQNDPQPPCGFLPADLRVRELRRRRMKIQGPLLLQLTEQRNGQFIGLAAEVDGKRLVER